VSDDSQLQAEETAAARIAGAFAGARLSEAFGETTIDVDPADVPRAIETAGAEGFDFLCDLAATDHLGFGGAVAGYWSAPTGSGAVQDMNREGSAGMGVVPPPLGPKRFSVSYQLLAREPLPARRLRLRTWADEGEPVPTIVPLVPGADYLEREAFDLMGIVFEGHPNLQRIFLPEGWDGHPHRKDYPIGGEPVQFSGDV
jgi:NADH:ubiquinone oxidoreductase subunit C